MIPGEVMQEQRLWTVAEVSEYMRVSPATIQRMLASRRLKGFKLSQGRVGWRIPDDEVRRIAGQPHVNDTTK
jgi:excisionase family DNA binding protein